MFFIRLLFFFCNVLHGKRNELSDKFRFCKLVHWGKYYWNTLLRKIFNIQMCHFLSSWAVLKYYVIKVLGFNCYKREVDKSVLPSSGHMVKEVLLVFFPKLLLLNIRVYSVYFCVSKCVCVYVIWESCLHMWSVIFRTIFYPITNN